MDKLGAGAEQLRDRGGVETLPMPFPTRCWDLTRADWNRVCHCGASCCSENPKRLEQCVREGIAPAMSSELLGDRNVFAPSGFALTVPLACFFMTQIGKPLRLIHAGNCQESGVRGVRGHGRLMTGSNSGKRDVSGGGWVPEMAAGS